MPPGKLDLLFLISYVSVLDVDGQQVFIIQWVWLPETVMSHEGLFN